MIAPSRLLAGTAPPSLAKKAGLRETMGILLLPKLISGEIDVSEAQETLKEVVA